MVRNRTPQGADAVTRRPLPPARIGHIPDGGRWPADLVPAPELREWVMATFIREGARLFNEDHAHLAEADLEFMWASTAYRKAGRMVLGQAEQVAFRVGGWQRARGEQQMGEWFGRVPDFVITLAADYSSICSDADFCALVEHELYHVAQALDEYGAPKFTDAGLPKLTLRGHDVEEFVGVVRRYGPTHEVQRLIDAAGNPPEVGLTNIARACGTCLLKSA
ncbi:hypothetical protein PSm6_44530 [Pseudomonas solani]|uniref:Putative phage metallopeptidase domain-containing protein n=1 Tax=Pseudomonas solani TaxID=2731552 RepID=A0ABM7LEU4_9PSED|nr:putative metallopeptidase [Pseudomonas solani]BCD88046.1 hypothetical protein PSm6_44530 [Pseudomonas solani]